MKKCSSLLSKGINACLFVFVCVLICGTFLQVLCRFILKIPVGWSEEVVRMGFVWLIFLGSACAIKEKSHLTLDMLASAVPLKVQKVMRIVVLVMILAVAIVLLLAGMNYVIRSIGKTAVTLPIPSNCVYAAVPVSATLMILFIIEQLVGELFPAYGKEGAE